MPSSVQTAATLSLQVTTRAKSSFGNSLKPNQERPWLENHLQVRWYLMNRSTNCLWAAKVDKQVRGILSRLRKFDRSEVIKLSALLFAQLSTTHISTLEVKMPRSRSGTSASKSVLQLLESTLTRLTQSDKVQTENGSLQDQQTVLSKSGTCETIDWSKASTYLVRKSPPLNLIHNTWLWQTGLQTALSSTGI